MSGAPEIWGKMNEAEYRKLPERFNPVKYDPVEWVRLAKEAGQRYMVITTKHHDGFCMFDSSYTSYKITNTPYKKDIIAELVKACEKEAMTLGFYYSPPDLNHPGFRDTSRPSRETWHGDPTRPEWSMYLDYMEAQLRELLTRYGDVFLIWFDGLGHQEKYDGYRFRDLIRGLSPYTLINNRIGLPLDFETPEQRMPAGVPVKGVRVYGTRVGQGEQLDPNKVPAPRDFRPWETCMTMNDTWAYNKRDSNYKSSTTLIRMLVEVASKGGNFLLNVGPTPEGTIQPEFQERLRDVGRWMEVNGESIYGSTYGPIQNLPFGKTTKKGSVVYVHVFDWPNGELAFDLPRDNFETLMLEPVITKVTMLAGKKNLEFSQQGTRLRIKVPAEQPDKHATVLALQTK